MILSEFFVRHPETAVAFSGGVDSAWLLHEAVKYARRCTAYFVNTPFQPAFELRDARETASLLGTELRVLELDVLQDREIVKNPKPVLPLQKRIFTAIAQAAGEDGYTVLLDGTNASDDASDRPGMRALQELAVFSPLRLCGVTKARVRQGAREAGIPVWDKPSYACLATRIPTGTAITAEDLRRVERGESVLMDLGLTDFRLRLRDGGLLQVREEQTAWVKAHWTEITDRLGTDLPGLTLDDTPRISREN